MDEPLPKKIAKTLQSFKYDVTREFIEKQWRKVEGQKANYRADYPRLKADPEYRKEKLSNPDPLLTPDEYDKAGDKFIAGLVEESRNKETKVFIAQFFNHIEQRKQEQSERKKNRSKGRDTEQER